jgi:hypothetical protein
VGRTVVVPTLAGRLAARTSDPSAAPARGAGREGLLDGGMTGDDLVQGDQVQEPPHRIPGAGDA